VKGRAALREGALLARRLGAEVFLLSVVVEDAGTRIAQGAGGASGSDQGENYKTVLEDGVTRLRQLGFHPKAELVVGDPAVEIGAYTRRIGADLVVVGHHPKSAFARWWSGPSGAYLSDHIDCSMLVSQNLVTDAAFAAELSRARPAAPDAGHQPTPEAYSDTVHDKNTGATADPAPPAQPARPSRKRLRRALLLVLPLAAVVGIWWYVTGGSVVSTNDAYINADKVGISTDVAGIVQRVEVIENQSVRAGQLLYRLDDQPFRLALDRAEAQVGMVRDSLEALKSNYADAQAQLKQAQYDVDYYVTEFHRVETLLKSHVASQTAFDAARRNLRNARQRSVSLAQQRAAVAANLDGDPQRRVEENPRYRQAVAQRNEAARELAHTVVKAPFAGIVTNVPSVSPGKYLPVMGTAFYLVATDHVWVDANPKETELTYVRPGQPATVRVDTYPNSRWTGFVESISPAAAQEFSLLPPQNTSGNWVKVVQRIPTRVRLDTRDQSLPPLRAGMSVEIAIDTGHPRGWPRFVAALFNPSRELETPQAQQLTQTQQWAPAQQAGWVE
jgi:membrane fusion protein (multidrug efflux system)